MLLRGFWSSNFCKIRTSVQSKSFSRVGYRACSNMSKFRSASLSSTTEKLVTARGPRQDNVLISYVTDIEGNLNYWNNFLDISKVVNISAASEPGAPRELSLAPGSMFVYGGDICDRSYGDLRVISDLLHLKEKYPDRVFLILGNRDINKLRLVAELLIPEDLCSDADADADTAYKVYWVSQGFPNASLAGAVKSVDGPPAPSVSLEEYRVKKLKWILHGSMGAPVAFEGRRVELQQLGLSSDDYAVTQSFIDSLLPAPIDSSDGTRGVRYCSSPEAHAVPAQMRHPIQGLLARFLEAGQLCFVQNDVVIVHGALHPFNLGWVPPHRGNARGWYHISEKEDAAEAVASTASEMTPLRLWGDVLNEFAIEEMRRYLAEIEPYVRGCCGRLDDATAGSSSSNVEGSYWATGGGYAHPQPGSALLQYGMGWLPDKELNRSVVYANYLINGRPAELHSDFCDTLRGLTRSHTVDGARLMLTGHQPHGDCPLLFQYNSSASSDGSRLRGYLLTADTSYSGDVRWDNSKETLAAAGPSPPLPVVACPGGIPDSRGVAVAEITFTTPLVSPSGSNVAAGGGHTTAVSVHGRLADGRDYYTRLPVIGSAECDQIPVGRGVSTCKHESSLGDEWWVKLPLISYGGGDIVSDAECEGGVVVGTEQYDYYLLSKSEGYSVINRVVTRAEYTDMLEKQQGDGRKT